MAISAPRLPWDPLLCRDLDNSTPQFAYLGQQGCRTGRRRWTPHKWSRAGITHPTQRSTEPRLHSRGGDQRNLRSCWSGFPRPGGPPEGLRMLADSIGLRPSTAPASATPFTSQASMTARTSATTGHLLIGQLGVVRSTWTGQELRGRTVFASQPPIRRRLSLTAIEGACRGLRPGDAGRTSPTGVLDIRRASQTARIPEMCRRPRNREFLGNRVPA